MTRLKALLLFKCFTNLRCKCWWNKIICSQTEEASTSKYIQRSRNPGNTMPLHVEKEARPDMPTNSSLLFEKRDWKRPGFCTNSCCLHIPSGFGRNSKSDPKKCGWQNRYLSYNNRQCSMFTLNTSGLSTYKYVLI